MSDQEYNRVKALFLEVRELVPELQANFLREKCGEDFELYKEVSQLLNLSEKTIDPSSAHRFLLQSLDIHKKENVPTTIGPYKIIKVIGEGGMGTVFLAEQENPKRQVALKVIQSGMASPQLIKRFEYEAQVLGQLHHPGIAQIFEADVAHLSSIDGEEEIPFFAMEFVDGVTLSEFVQTEPTHLEEKLKIFISICDAVEHAHQKGVIHRDLKPSNILIGQDGQPKILDFGVARATDSDVQATMMTNVGQMIGTLAYMSPEQVKGIPENIDTRTDVYSLGVILYELLSGKLPVSVSEVSLVEAARQIQEDDASSLGTFDSRFRGDLDTIVAKALEKDKERRYPTASAMAKDIDCYLRDEPILARPASTLYQLKKFTRRNKGLVGGLITTFVVLIIGISVSGILAYKSHQSEGVAQRAVYKSNLSAASFAFSVGDYAQALTHLNNVPKKFHSTWEYKHFKSRLAFDYFGWIRSLGNKGKSLSDVSFRGNHPIGIRTKEQKINLLDLKTGTIISSHSSGEKLLELQLSDNAQQIITLSQDYLLRILDADTFDPIFEINLNEKKTKYWLDRKGTLVALTDKNGLRVFDLSTKELKFKRPNGKNLPHQHGGVVTFSHDSSKLAWVPQGDRPKSWLRRMEVVSCENGEVLGQSTLRSTPIRGLAFSDQDSVLAYSAEGSIQVVDLENYWVTQRAEIEVSGAEDSYPSELKFFGEDHQRIVVSGMDEVVRVFDLTSMKQVYAVKAVGRVKHLRISRDGKSLAISGRGDWIQLWQWPLSSPQHVKKFVSSVSSVAFNKTGDLIVGAADPNIKFIDSISKNELARVNQKGRSLSLAFNISTSHLSSLYWSETRLNFHSWSLLDLGDQQKALPYEFNSLPHFREVLGNTRVRFGIYEGQHWASSPDGSLIAQSKHDESPYSLSSEVRILDSSSHEILYRIEGHEGYTCSVAISHDNLWLASGGLKDELIYIWNIKTGEKIAELKGHQGEIFSLDFSPDRTRLVSGGRDRKVRIWDTENSFELFASLSGHDSFIYAVAFSPDGSQIISGSADKTLRIWDSVSNTERFQQTENYNSIVKSMTPYVDKLLEEKKSYSQIYDLIKRDNTLSEDQKRAASRMLLHRSAQKKSKFPFF